MTNETEVHSEPKLKVSVADLGALFLWPKRFFRDRDLDVRSWFLTALLCSGITTASGRIDQNLMRADLSQPRVGWDEFAPVLLDSWIAYWLFLLGVGVVSAALYWYVGGWWYRVRLRWSGDANPDPRMARLVMISAAFVMSAPQLAYSLLETASFPNYGAAWESESVLPAFLLIFPFWSVYASYRGVRTRFSVTRWRARIWFLILPVLVFAVAFGVIALLYAMMEPVFTGGGGQFA